MNTPKAFTNSSPALERSDNEKQGLFNFGLLTQGLQLANAFGVCGQFST